jgi:AraC-like DNA-binding protein
MRRFLRRPEWRAEAQSAPQLFHRTDSFRFLDERGKLAVERTEAGQMVLARVWSTGHDITLEEPERVTVLFPWAGRITCAVQDDRVAAAAGDVLAFGPNRRRTVVERPGRDPYLADVVTFPLAVLQEVQIAEDLKPDASAPHPTIADAVTARLRIRTAHILNADRGQKQMGADSPQIVDLTMDLALALAVAIMQDRYAEPMSIAALARDLGCSYRSLEAAFHEAGHPPRQSVLGAIRLDAARIRLLSGGPSVTTCALECGITHLGRFAQAYRQRFGEYPADTLAARG